MIGMAQIGAEVMSIGQVANATGVATTALRYYERVGILKPTLRSQAGYRLYGRLALEQLEFIRAAQAAGFTLDDVRVLVELDGGQGRERKAEVREVIQKRLVEVKQRMNDLRRVRAALGAALKQCEESDGDCPVLKELHSGEKKISGREVKHAVKEHANK
jgi:DNA-binding transcriptional MerR regulator